MITATQVRAARVLVGMDQRQLAERSGLSLPTIQRMEASQTMVRGNVDSLVRLIEALEAAGVELIDPGATSQGQGRGVRLKAVARAPEAGPSGSAPSRTRTRGTGTRP
jgi:transcriptional regulator with XRE-family HTH domain